MTNLWREAKRCVDYSGYVTHRVVALGLSMNSRLTNAHWWSWLTSGTALGALALVGCVSPGPRAAPGVTWAPDPNPAAGPARLPIFQPVPGTGIVARHPAPIPEPPATVTQVRHQVQVPAPPPREPKSREPKSPEPKSDAVPADSTKLTLDQVINAVVVSDPKLRAGFEAVNQANADVLTASLRPNPTLFTDAQLLPLTRPFTLTRQGGPPQQDVQLSYPIDWFVFGKRAANIVSATLGVRVSEAEFADRVRLRVLEAGVAYYDVLEAKGLLALAEQDAANLRRAESAVRKAVEAGGKTQVEANRIRLDLLRSQQAIRDAETALVTARAKLRAMIGRSDADPAFDVADALDAPLAVAPPSEDAFDVAVRNRPDLQAARLRTDHARTAVEVERRKAYPDVTPTFGYTRQYQSSIGFPDANSWSAAVTMSLPIFNRNQGNRARAASVVAQSELVYRAALADLRAEVDSVAQQVRAARANADAVADDQLRLAREVLDSVSRAYEAGGVPLVDLIDAQRNFRETYRLSVTSRAAYWRAIHRFQAVVGETVTH